MEYRLEDDLMKKSRPKFGSKRYKRLSLAIDGHGKPWCEICGKLLFNPQSKLIHQGSRCQNQIKNKSMNTKHTPEPWVARIDEIGIDVFESKSGFGVTQIGNYDELRKADYPIEKAKANAKLIAAAPELLEFIEKHYQFLNLDAQKEAVILINKATE